jgi:hypothetical protein
MYEKFLPEFKVVEINLSTAHLIGHVIAQAPSHVKGNGALLASVKITSAKKGEGDYYFIENGVIAGLGTDGRLSNFNPLLHSQPCLVYNDELITGPFYNLNKYAHYVENPEKPTYVRALPLYLNDAFTTNNFVGEVSSDEVYANVVDGILTLCGKEDGPLFIGKKTTLPNRDEAVEFTYIGKRMSEPAQN